MRSRWRYALLGVGVHERVYALLAGVVYIAETKPRSDWVQHKGALPAHITWWEESESESIISPERAVEFVLAAEGGEDGSA